MKGTHNESTNMVNIYMSMYMCGCVCVLLGLSHIFQTCHVIGVFVKQINWCKFNLVRSIPVPLCSSVPVNTMYHMYPHRVATMWWACWTHMAPPSPSCSSVSWRRLQSTGATVSTGSAQILNTCWASGLAYSGESVGSASALSSSL